jgi:hypothetical protein
MLLQQLLGALGSAKVFILLRVEYLGDGEFILILCGFLIP